MNKTIKNISGIIAAGLALAGFVSCESVDYPDRFQSTEGKPTVEFVRYTDKDVFIEQAYMDEVVCLVGDNLTSVRELWFNDQQAILNTSFITKNTLVASVPAKLAQVTTDEMYLVYGSAKKDTLTVPFRVLPPAPQVNALSNEWAKVGEVVTISGNYFVEDDANPIEVSFSGVAVPHNTITMTMTSLTFPIPAGAGPGTVSVTTYSGLGISKFQYLDTRNILFDWDGTYGMALGHGWRPGDKVLRHPGDDSFAALDGNYIKFAMDGMQGDAGADWAEDAMSFDYWPEPDAGYPELSSLPTFASYLSKYGVGGLTVKFEYLIPAENPWMCQALQIMFSGNAQVTAATATNGYFSDTSFPRGLWIPWAATGSYDTNGKWMTASIPLSTFVYGHDGKDLGKCIDNSYFTGLAFFVWNGGLNGTTCSPSIAIDNIRVVPAQ